ncbi:glutamine-hydrolyzing GMP synthase [Gammaproteobacteria bacterium]|jgi:GMP synthase (glutamine-hydrolysing)|nr:glutamine-hydrolyzing GMP synthase [Gammaproteobacteria bacterium]
MFPKNTSPAKKSNFDTILVLDFGSQYTQLIARRVREMNVYSEILPWDIPVDRIQALNPKGVILSGGPESVTNSNTPRAPEIIFELGIPILGICYGMQTLAEQFGGQVAASKIKEFGHAEITIENTSNLFEGIDIGSNIDVWMSHGDHVASLPDTFNLIASTESAPIAAMQHAKKPIYALQFHPEVTHTKEGSVVLENFIINICSATRGWEVEGLIAQKIDKIKKQVGNQKVLLGLSGGVDSSVAAMLLDRAIGKNLICMFVDNGLLRKNEAEDVESLFREKLDLNLIVIDAKKIFHRHLKDVSDPEQKRKVIGRTFIDIFDNESAKLKDKINFLAQGTIYPDVIESSGSESKEVRVIKSHHNVGGLPDDMEMELVEPLRDLFKDEVRKIGLELGLPPEMINRHPFPGPGLGVRILGEITAKKVRTLQEADAIFMEELIKAGLYNEVSQAFCAYLPVKSVGVVGDERRYADVIAIRAVVTIDFMTATWAKLPYEFLELVSNRIVNEIEEISRVVYDISSKPPATIEWE